MPYRLATSQCLGPGARICVKERMGWMKGFEPSASRATIWRANQLRHIHHIHLALRCLQELARQKGLEPLTYCLEGSCSIQLSYWRIWSG